VCLILLACRGRAVCIANDNREKLPLILFHFQFNVFYRQICHAEMTLLLQCTIIVRKSHRHPERILGDCAKVAFSQLILAFTSGSSTVPLCVRLLFVNFSLRPHRQKCNASDKRVGRTVRASSNSRLESDTSSYELLFRTMTDTATSQNVEY
jgi:hypothetical protein